MVDIQPPGIPATHDIDFGMSNRSVFGEKIPVGDTISPIIIGPDAEHFSVIALGIRAGSEGIEGAFFIALIDGGETLGIPKGIRVISGPDVQTSVRTELHRSSMVATLLALLLISHQNLFTLHVERAV